MKLDKLMTYHADVQSPQEVGAGPFGTRMIFQVTGGWFEGSKLKGKLLPGGGDWLLAGADGHGRIDARTTLETEDGGLIYMHYSGVVEMNERIMGALEGGEASQFGDAYFMTAMRLETGDERYAWLNRILTLGQGRVLPGAVEYDVYQVGKD